MWAGAKQYSLHACFPPVLRMSTGTVAQRLGRGMLVTSVGFHLLSTPSCPREMDVPWTDVAVTSAAGIGGPVATGEGGGGALVACP